MQISAKNQKQGRVASVIQFRSSYSQVAVEQTDADGVATGSFIHAAIPVDICKNGACKGNMVTCIFQQLQSFWQSTINFLWIYYINH